jgi:hypothetical protein
MLLWQQFKRRSNRAAQPTNFVPQFPQNFAACVSIAQVGQ